MEGVTGSIPVAPTIPTPAARILKSAVRQAATGSVADGPGADTLFRLRNLLRLDDAIKLETVTIGDEFQA